MLLEGGYLPVISAPAISHQHEIVNTDNDTAAAVMAASLGIRTMVYLFEAPGFLENAHNEDSVVAKIPRAQIDSFLAQSGVCRRSFWEPNRLSNPESKW